MFLITISLFILSFSFSSVEAKSCIGLYGDRIIREIEVESGEIFFPDTVASAPGQQSISFCRKGNSSNLKVLTLTPDLRLNLSSIAPGGCFIANQKKDPNIYHCKEKENSFELSSNSNCFYYKNGEKVLPKKLNSQESHIFSVDPLGKDQAQEKIILNCNNSFETSGGVQSVRLATGQCLMVFFPQGIELFECQNETGQEDIRPHVKRAGL